jgi:adenosine deaminase
MSKAWSIKYGILTAIFLVFFGLQALANEAGTIREFDSTKGNEPMLIAFLKEMPKGADLHSHVSGAIYAEFMLDAAVESNLNADLATGAFTTSTTNTVPASSLKNDTTLMRKFLNAASMRGNYPDTSGHDLFFDSFSKFGPALGQIDYAMILAEVIKRAKGQNIQYLELMGAVAPPDAMRAAQSGLIITGDNWEEALQTMEQRFPALLAASKAFLDKLDNDAADQVGVSRPITNSSPTKVRYIFSTSRTGKSTSDFFAAIACGMAIMQNDSRVVGINIVAPEDDYYSRHNFETQMKMLDFLWQRMGKPNITLHAGELTLEYSPVEVMNSRIRQSIETGHAKRIGHGVSIAWEENLPELLNKMRQQKIAVEICLTSNAGILNVSGNRHPLPLYRREHIPFNLNTDDEGVNRSNLTMEFVKAVQTYQLSYVELKNIVRSSLEYAFLPGGSLYIDGDYNKLQPEFSEVRHENWQPSAKAEALLHKSEKLREEVILERSFIEFEKKYK